ncbi:hypothetical protein VNO77_02243 [Canavalia gladiata]|uniref:Uncharacterized protein n=1 Tax=Canavalia gladiata TaxID=3824 RepID=A0AAN9R2V6_CANGL
MCALVLAYAVRENQHGELHPELNVNDLLKIFKLLPRTQCCDVQRILLQFFYNHLALFSPKKSPLGRASLETT